MLIKNNQPRLHQIGVRLADTPTASAVLAVTLFPGVNEVDPAAWDSATKIKMIQFYLKKGILEVVGKTDGLTGKPVGDAVKLVENTFDLTLLARWAEDDSRGKVQRAITEQVTLIHAAGDVEKKEA